MVETDSLQELECIEGIVEKITFRNDSNAYTVAVVRVEKEVITVVGIMPFLNEGDSASFQGSYTFHPTYGRQLSVKSFERKTPQNAAAILRYLSSGSIKGIGPSTATKIVERFGEDALEIIGNNPEQLTIIKNSIVSYCVMFIVLIGLTLLFDIVVKLIVDKGISILKRKII